MRVAVVGTGISGLVAAYLLNRSHEVTVFESRNRLGGHTHTHHIEIGDETHDVDTGFIVYNERNYPLFTKLLRQLDVRTETSDMSFSVRNERTGLEFSPKGANGLFAQRKNALSPSFHRMLVDILRFQRHGRDLIRSQDGDITLEEFLDRGNYSDQMIENFAVPLGAAIWSADPSAFAKFPMLSLARFYASHGLLSVGDHPQWRFISGGSSNYHSPLVSSFVERVRLGTGAKKVVRHSDGVEVLSSKGDLENFDAVVLACHSDQALRMLGDPDNRERGVLGAIAYQPNDVTLHTDRSFLPKNPRSWASWNYHVLPDPTACATLTYRMNSLQKLESKHQILVTLNRNDEIDPATVLGRWSYRHPVFDSFAMQAQTRRDEIQGRGGVYYAGAYWGYGFHEDGVRSAVDVASHFGETL